MSWKILQTRRFARAFKKLNPQAKSDVEAAIVIVAADPTVGEQKKGDLNRLRVYKFHSGNQLFLLGFTIEALPRLIYLEAVGAHENFYRDVKR